MGEETKTKVRTRQFEETTVEVQEILMDDFSYDSYGDPNKILKSWVQKFNELAIKTNILEFRTIEYNSSGKENQSNYWKKEYRVTGCWIRYEVSTKRILKEE